MIFEVTDPETGKVLELEGTSPPTEDELAQIFSTINVKKSTKQGLGNRILQGRARVTEAQKTRLRLLRNVLPKALERIGQPGMGNPLSDELERQKALALAALTTVGGVGQIQESAIAGPAKAAQEGRFGEMGQELSSALRGENVTEFGDVLQGAGLGPRASAVGGLAMASLLAPEALIGKALLTLSKKIAVKGAFSGAKKLKGMSMKLLLRKNGEEVDHLIKTNGRGITTKNLQPNNAASQDLANDIIRKTERFVHEPAKRAYNNLPDKVGNRIVPSDVGERIADKVQNVLSEELDDAVVENIVKTPIRRSVVVKSVGAKPDVTTTVEKVVRKPKVTEFTKGLTEQTGGVTSGEEIVQKVSPRIQKPKVVRETTKRVVRETAKPAEKLSTEAFTLQDLLTKAGSGETVPAKDWITAVMRLRKMAKTDARAAKVISAISDDLAGAIPELENAANKWRLWTRVLEARDRAIGKAVKTAEGKTVASKGDNLAFFFRAPGESSVLRSDIQGIDNILQSVTRGKVRGLTESVKDVAATSSLSVTNPSMLSVSIGGAGLVAASRLGVPAPVVGLMGAGVLTESIPKASAVTGKLILQGIRLPKTPLGNAVSRIGAVTGDVTSRTLGEAIGRQVTGRNDQR